MSEKFKLLQKFLRRLNSHGLIFSLVLVTNYIFGLNLINLVNAFIFRKHAIVTSCDISIILPRKTVLPHPVGIVIGYGVKMGENVRIQQNVTIGRLHPKENQGYPYISNNVRIGAGAVILGDIRVGEGSIIGANSVVLHDVKPETTVVGAPAKPINI
jgi:serine O-acetyltransferase